MMEPSCDERLYVLDKLGKAMDDPSDMKAKAQEWVETLPAYGHDEDKEITLQVIQNDRGTWDTRKLEDAYNWVHNCSYGHETDVSRWVLARIQAAESGGDDTSKAMNWVQGLPNSRANQKDTILGALKGQRYTQSQLQDAWAWMLRFDPSTHKGPENPNHDQEDYDYVRNFLLDQIK